jgi:hypothetical protein
MEAPAAAGSQEPGQASATAPGSSPAPADPADRSRSDGPCLDTSPCAIPVLSPIPSLPSGRSDVDPRRRCRLRRGDYLGADGPGEDSLSVAALRHQPVMAQHTPGSARPMAACTSRTVSPSGSRSSCSEETDFDDGFVLDQDPHWTAGSGGSPRRPGRPVRPAAGRGAGEETSGVRATRGAGPVIRWPAHLGPHRVHRQTLGVEPTQSGKAAPEACKAPEGMAPRRLGPPGRPTPTRVGYPLRPHD